MDLSIEEKVLISIKTLASGSFQNCSKDFIKVSQPTVSNTLQAFTDCLTKKAKQQWWSRGHKARGQGQGHKKNPRPRPRTAFPRTDSLAAKDRNARGQGQGPRTQAQVLSKKKKKGLHKNFSSDLHKKTFSKKCFKRSTRF